MKIILFFGLFFCCAKPVKAQIVADTLPMGKVTVVKDPRIDMLGKKMADYNEGLAMNVRTGKGYRLMVISTDDREKAMAVRSQLYKLYPEQKQYMTYQVPSIKIRFGNFVEKAEAEKVRKNLLDLKVVTNNIYILPETIEIKPEKKELPSTQ